MRTYMTEHLSSGMEALTFTLGCEEYGIDIQKVQEIRGYAAVTYVANAPASLKGVLNLRGTIVPVIDMRILLNVGKPSYDQFTVVIILTIGTRIIGAVVDGVSDVITLAGSQIRPAPRMRADIGSDYLIGLGTVDDRMLILIDIDHLLLHAKTGLAEEVMA